MTLVREVTGALLPFFSLLLGVKVLFRVGLVLLKFGLRSEVRAKCPSMYETLQALRTITPAIMAEEFLLLQVQCYGTTHRNNSCADGK